MRTKIPFVLTLALCVLSVATMNAQDTCCGFSVTDTGDVIWQKVYETGLSYNEIFTTIVNSGMFVGIVETDNTMTFRMLRTPVKYEHMGYSRMNIPIYVSSSDFSCFVTIQNKAGRYRVTVEDIVLIHNIKDHFGEDGEETDLEDYAIKKGKLTKSFEGSPAAIYDKFLTDIFAFKTRSYMGDDW